MPGWVQCWAHGLAGCPVDLGRFGWMSCALVGKLAGAGLPTASWTFASPAALPPTTSSACCCPPRRSDEEVRELHPAHTQASIRSLLPRLRYFDQVCECL